MHHAHAPLSRWLRRGFKPPRSCRPTRSFSPTARELRLRPLGSDDRDGLAALFARLSPESRYRRFLSPKPKLTPRELVYLTDIDRFHHEAVAAVDPRDGSIVGVGRYVRFPDRPSVAEVGFEVADELQSMGIGTALATHIVQHARANGLALLTAATLWDNRPARAILRRLGFRARASQGSVIELDLELDSPSAAESAPRRPRAPNSTLRRQTTDARRTRRAGSDAFQLLTRKEPHERRS